MGSSKGFKIRKHLGDRVFWGPLEGPRKINYRFFVRQTHIFVIITKGEGLRVGEGVSSTVIESYFNGYILPLLLLDFFNEMDCLDPLDQYSPWRNFPRSLRQRPWIGRGI